LIERSDSFLRPKSEFLPACHQSLASNNTADIRDMLLNVVKPSSFKRFAVQDINQFLFHLNVSRNFFLLRREKFKFVKRLYNLFCWWNNKKSPHLMEEACKMGLSGGFEQGKPETALPELKRLIPVNTKRVNPQNKF
jgi:hypothetical protein